MSNLNFIFTAMVCHTNRTPDQVVAAADSSADSEAAADSSADSEADVLDTDLAAAEVLHTDLAAAGTAAVLD